ncbi:MAG TPA: hypothetical protein VJ757_14415 [Pseudonocardiaceae bacterium]|nr:hypothetical protein [Pseudonocardiaceae bacterium]
MTRSDHSATPAPKGRTDTTRPSRTRRGSHRQPYPNAPARASSARHGAPRASIPSRPRTPPTVPTPATVWACGPTAVDPDATWPAPILTKIVTSFSKSGDRVVLMPWPTATPRPLIAPGKTGGLTDRTRTAERDAHLATTLAAIDDLDRTAALIHLQRDSTASGPASRPFWADLLQTPEAPCPFGTHRRTDCAPDTAASQLDATTGTTDLIITSLHPEHSGDRASDHVALLAARLLRVGGILVVLTHSDWSSGELRDPTGPVVACAQNADLLYLQHIIALHTPIRRGHFHLSPALARAPVPHHSPGQPAPHHRISSDVLVFAQPHEHEPPPLLSTTALKTGTHR